MINDIRYTLGITWRELPMYHDLVMKLIRKSLKKKNNNKYKINLFTKY